MREPLRDRTEDALAGDVEVVAVDEPEEPLPCLIASCESRVLRRQRRAALPQGKLGVADSED